MTGLQVEHILNLIEEKTAASRHQIRRQVAAYLRDADNMRHVVQTLADEGEVEIPTDYGPIKLTKEELELAVA
jgi:hypothetical protein